MDKNKINSDNSDNSNSYLKNIYGINKGIIELKYKDFKIKNKKLYINNKYFTENKGLIIFYAPWCKHCKDISSDLIDLAFSNLNIFPLGAVNIEDTKNENYKLTKIANIIQIPSAMYISKDGSLKKYNYDIKIDNLKYFINMNL
jgi:thiol-disulfide isomerase/thioredoxin